MTAAPGEETKTRRGRPRLASSRARRRERKRTARRFGEAYVEHRDYRDTKYAQKTAAIANGALQLGDRRLTALRCGLRIAEGARAGRMPSARSRLQAAPGRCA